MSNKILCDSCNADLSPQETPVTRHYLILQCDRITNLGGYSCDVYVLPPLIDTMRFCGLGCLRTWIELKPDYRKKSEELPKGVQKLEDGTLWKDTTKIDIFDKKID